MAKVRLDVFLCEGNYFPSREKARAAIMAGEVIVNGEKVDKAGFQVKEDAQITLIGEKLPFVSRGGLKLDKAVKTFGLELEGKIMADIGASTGGFTDCALQNGAVKVYAVDVGYGQLAWELRQDPRVVVKEKTNARYLDETVIPDLLDVATIDVSFISLKKILPALSGRLKETGEVAALIKPQFEAGKEKIGKNGVVRDKETHLEVIASILDFLPEAGLYSWGLTYSPIKGPKGNIEYLLWLKKYAPEPGEAGVTMEVVNGVVEEAFGSLNLKE